MARAAVPFRSTSQEKQSYGSPFGDKKTAEIILGSLGSASRTA
ncbi:hypothetical protein DJ90_5522 [Paenibacillus macerans]|uniref:Uncharacterized protein n=1 Tax=Paenibacillus macerans TaxID=44252 RepID=A0A090YAA5_PAEMA|nr:hypothetical protein DJ90_5522 [Paenibacillus macerans]